jgi:F-type H+-transporting ATPase subunit b
MGWVRSRSVIATFTVVLLLLSGLAWPCAALASGGGGHGASDRSGDLWDLLFRFVNFALLVIILVWALKKVNIKDFFAARTEEIRQKLSGLKETKEASEKECGESEAKLQAFEEEKKAILEQYRQEGLAEKERIIAEAKDRVKLMVEQARLTVQQEMQSAKDSLKMEIVDLAARRAEETVSRNITDEDQKRLVDDFIERVGKIH